MYITKELSIYYLITYLIYKNWVRTLVPFRCSVQFSRPARGCDYKYLVSYPNFLLPLLDVRIFFIIIEFGHSSSVRTTSSFPPSSGICIIVVCYLPRAIVVCVLGLCRFAPSRPNCAPRMLPECTLHLERLPLTDRTVHHGCCQSALCTSSVCPFPINLYGKDAAIVHFASRVFAHT